MSSKYIPGLGFVAISNRKSPEEIDATFQYYENVAPQYAELGGFVQGFSDVHSIAYEGWKQLNRTEDENKNAWMERQVEEWGGMVGFTDSVNLEEYYKQIEKIRALTEIEEGDRGANVLAMENFKADMYNAYDNEDGDISDVQSKYGYDEEQLGVLSGLAEMGKMAFTNTGYMLGSITGMVAKDPELLLLGMFRIPALAGQLTARATQMATMAMRVQPKYVQGLSKAIQSQRGRAAIGRGVEGAVYGGVYEALHDLTFDGHIQAENMERGIALGTLLGTAFGGLSKNVGKQSWLLNKMTSENAAKNISQLKYSLQDPNLKWQKADTPLGADASGGKSVLSYEKGWQQKLADIKAKNKGFIYNKTTKTYEPPEPTDPKPKIDATGQDVNIDNVNPDFRVKVPTKAKLPEGLDNQSKLIYWQDRVKQLVEQEINDFTTPFGTLMDEYTSIGDADGVVLSSKQAASKIFSQSEKNIRNRQDTLILEKNKNGTKKYTKDEAAAIAAKEEARALEKRNPEFIKKEGTNKHSASSKKWGTEREKQLGKDRIAKGEDVVIKTSEDFSHVFKETLKNLPTPTAKQYLTAGGLGATAGLLIAEEDKTFGGLLGLTAGLIVRNRIKPLNVSTAQFKLRMYSVINKGEGLSKTLQMQAGKTVAVLHQVLKNKNPQVNSLEFLAYLENYSAKSKVIDGIDFGLKGRKKLDIEVQNAIESYRQLMKDFEVVAKKLGVFSDTQLQKDYVTHIFRQGKKLADGDIEPFIKALNKKGSRLDTTTTFSNPRKLIKNIIELQKSGKYPNLETDVFKILDAYTRSMSKAIAGKNITRQLEETGFLDGRNTFSMIITPKEFNRLIDVPDVGKMTLEKYAKDKLGYQVSNHPALQDRLIHPLMKKSVDDFYKPEIGTEGLGNRLLLINNAMKRIAVSFSFFHAQSLIFSGIYAGMLGEGLAAASSLVTGGARGKAAIKRFNYVRRVARGEFESYGRDANGKPITKTNIHGREATGRVVGEDVLKEMAEAGVGLGLKASEYVDAGYNSVKGFMEKYAKPLDNVQTFVDKWTWDKTHDIFKMFTYLTVKDRMMQVNPRGVGKILPVLSRIRGKDLGTWKQMDEAEAKLSAAAFVNDAFGGQSHSKLAMEWQQKAIANANNPKGTLYNMIALMTTPSKAKYSNLVLFSPDWTISNLRIGFRGLGMTKDLLGKISKGQKLTPKEIAEWNIYMGYLTRGFISTSAVAYIMHELINDDNEEFDLENFWLHGRLPLGAGEEMVVSKQIAEPMHWIMSPVQTFLNKSSTLPKVGLEMLFNKEYISMKNGTLIGPEMDKRNATKMSLYALGKVTPISLSKAKQAAEDDEDNYTVGDVVKQTMMGSIGFPIYGRKQ